MCEKLLALNEEMSNLVREKNGNSFVFTTKHILHLMCIPMLNMRMHRRK